MDVPLLICAVFLLALSVPLYFGKMSNMIAGYNTMTDKEKEQYDELKLCRILAVTLDVMAFVLCLGVFDIISITDVSLIGIVILIICIILGNTLPKRK